MAWIKLMKVGPLVELPDHQRPSFEVLFMSSYNTAPPPPTTSLFYSLFASQVLFVPFKFLYRDPNSTSAMATSRSLLLALTLMAVLNLASAYKDSLSRTFCFCGLESHPHPGVAIIGPSELYLDIDESQATYYRFEYYNHHLDQTFVMEQTCRSDYNIIKRDEKHREHNEFQQNDCLDLALGRLPEQCKSFDLLHGEESKHHHHEFCYQFTRHETNRRDLYSWDGQQRKVSRKHNRKSESDENARAFCEPICINAFGLHYKSSKKDVIDDQDNMCEICD